MENRYSIGFALRRSQNSNSQADDANADDSYSITANMRYRRESSSGSANPPRSTSSPSLVMSSSRAKGGSHSGTTTGTTTGTKATIANGGLSLPSYLKLTGYGERFNAFNGTLPSKNNYTSWLLASVDDDSNSAAEGMNEATLTSLSSTTSLMNPTSATANSNTSASLDGVSAVNPATIDGTQFHLPQIFTSRLAAQLDALNGNRVVGGHVTSNSNSMAMALGTDNTIMDPLNGPLSSRDASVGSGSSRDILLADDMSLRYESAAAGWNLGSNNNSTKLKTSSTPSGGAGSSPEVSLAARSKARLTPLPFGWAKKDTDTSVILSSDDCTVEFMADSRNTVHETIAVRTLDYIPTLCGVYYFEVEIGGTPNTTEDAFTIGLCDEEFSMSKLPGFETNSWGYHGDDGRIMASGGTAKTFGPTFGFGNVIGCGINFYEDSIFYTKDGVLLGTAFENVLSNVSRRRFYPVIGMKSGRISRTNFGQLEFRFDIDHYVKEAKKKVMDEILATEAQSLGGSHNINDFVNDIVGSYFKHVGYFETAKAFTDDVAYEKSAQSELQSGQSESESRKLKDDEAVSEAAGSHEVHMEDSPNADAVVDGVDSMDQDNENIQENETKQQKGKPSSRSLDDTTFSEMRQKARNLVVEGDIDGAISLLETHFPSVLSKDSVIYFEMRCHKFIELIRAAAAAVSSTATTTTTRKSKAKNDQLLAKAIEYGQKLRTDYKDDVRPEIKKVMSIIFSLLAYEDPTTAPEVYKVFTKEGLVPLADGLNSAILVSEGGSSVPFLESIVQQSIQVTWELSDHKNHKADLINVHEDFLHN